MLLLYLTQRSLAPIMWCCSMPDPGISAPDHVFLYIEARHYRSTRGLMFINTLSIKAKKRFILFGVTMTASLPGVSKACCHCYLSYNPIYYNHLEP